jgi:hypothetical protein
LSEILAGAPDDALDGFLRRWHGVTAPLASQPVPLGVPRALRRLHQVRAAAPRFFAVNHLLPPRELEPDGDKALFYVEEQGVVVWGIDRDRLDAADPPVWCRVNEPGAPWLLDAPSVSVFLLQLAVMNATCDAPHAAGAAWLTPEDTDRALAPLRALALPAWHWPAYPSRFYAGDDAVAFAGPNVGSPDEVVEYLSVFVGALTEDALRFVEPHLTGAWEYCSLRPSSADRS